MTNRRSRGASPETPEPGASQPRAEATPEQAAESQADSPIERPATVADSQEETAQIDEVSARTGLTKRALRYYEEIGLLERPTRTMGNYRQYTERDIARLQSIKRWRDLLGFSLSEIRELVTMDEDRQQTKAEWPLSDARHRLDLLDHSDDLARRTLEVIADKIAGLEQMSAELRERLDRHERIRAELQAELASQPNGDQEARDDNHAKGAHNATHEPMREPSDVR